MPKGNQQPSTSRGSSMVTRQRPRSPRSPPKAAKKRQKKTHAPAPPTTPEEEKVYGETTDPSLVTHPDKRYVHKAMLNAWKITRGNPMCFIFDSHSPARQFKRGVPFTDNQDFPLYGRPPHKDLTESDTDTPGLMPFSPCNYKCVSPPIVWEQR
jgi:hypothetical protein